MREYMIADGQVYSRSPGQSLGGKEKKQHKNEKKKHHNSLLRN
jgi:hypothetical protein